MDKYSSIITNIGEERIAHAIALGEKVNIATMSVGDGMGTIPVPSPDQTTLLNEVYRAPLNSLKIYPGRNNTIMAEMVIPSDEGGYWIREAALYSESGEMLAVCSVPESYKPKLVEGSGRVQTIRIMLVVSSTEHIKLLVDPTVVLATTQYVDDAVKVALDAATAAMELAKQKATFDEIYPIGDVKFFTTKLNPNVRWPGTKWLYIGENKTIRLGKADGSNVMTTGGSDTATLTDDHLPAHTHVAKGSTADFDYDTKDVSSFDHGTKATTTFDYGSKNTSQNGGHNHQGGWGAPGEKWGVIWSGTDNQGSHDRNLTSDNGEHQHTVQIGEHSHNVAIGSHSHNVNIGKHAHTIDLTTSETGKGNPFSIVESHIILMGWYRAE